MQLKIADKKWMETHHKQKTEKQLKQLKQKQSKYREVIISNQRIKKYEWIENNFR